MSPILIPDPGKLRDLLFPLPTVVRWASGWGQR